MYELIHRCSSMKRNELPSFAYWTYNAKGEVIDTNVTPPKDPVDNAEVIPNERRLFDYDKLNAESDWPYRAWWILWKRIHPEWALIPEKKPEMPPPPPKPKVTLKQLSCRRYNHTWTPRSKEPPVQCPKCHSPYWNRERKKRRWYSYLE